MAFGKRECDDIYAAQIRPVLSDLGIEAVRVDRRQHGDDLNAYIIRMLRESDLALADLTYARPSVYYEAGFAERTVPVIYTVRRDHLDVAQPDDRLRVHFDLQMKKIIPWRDMRDRRFARDLRRRILYFAAPLRRRLRSVQGLERDRREFAALSVASRCERILTVFGRALKRKRFWTAPLADVDNMHPGKLEPARVLVGIKNADSVCHCVIMLAAQSLSARQIKMAVTRIGGCGFVARDAGVGQYTDHFILCTLGRLPPDRLTAAFPDMTPVAGASSCSMMRDFGQGTDLWGRRVVVHLVPAVDSTRAIRCAVRDVLATLPDGRSNRLTRVLGYQQFSCRRRIVLGGSAK
jgi:hypothetical protein